MEAIRETMSNEKHVHVDEWVNDSGAKATIDKHLMRQSIIKDLMAKNAHVS